LVRDPDYNSNPLDPDTGEIEELPTVQTGLDEDGIRHGVDLTTQRLLMLRNGYWPVPITAPNYRHEKVKSPGKQPFFKDWRNICASATEATAEGWSETIDNHTNTGLLCNQTPGVDIDVRVPELAKLLAKTARTMLGDTPLERVGMAPKTLLAYRTETPVRKIETPEFFFPDGSKAQIEVLGEGQQFVAYGIHPDTGRAYEWLQGGPDTVPWTDLPVVTEAQLRAFVAAAEAILRNAGGRTKQEIEGKATKPAAASEAADPGATVIDFEKAASDNAFFREVNHRALGAIGKWFPRIFKTARQEPGTGAWRVTSKDLGRPHLEEDLSMHPTKGGYDFGTEKSVSPIDVVMEWGGAADAKQAAFWLCDRLQVDPVTLGWKEKPAKEGKAADSKETEIKWSDPLPLVAPDEEPVPYPIDSLPPVLRDACVAYQAFGQQPMALVACSALAAASLAAQGHADIERAPGLVGPISLNIIVVAQSGERKTSADKRMSKAVRQWEMDKKDAMKPEVDAARAKIAAFEAERDGLLAKIKTQAGKHAKAEVGDADQMKRDLEELKKRTPVPPVVPDLFYEDVTPEKMAEDLAAGWPSASLWSDEAGLVVGGHGMGRDSITRYLSLINRFWDGQAFPRKRSTTKSFTVKGRRLTTCLMMQAPVLKLLLAAGDGVSRGSGFLARFLMAWPVSTMGIRFYRDGDPNHPALVTYDARLRELLDMPLPVKDEGMVLDPPVLPLSAEAHKVWVEVHNDVEGALARQGEFEDVKDFAAKTADNAARIAGVFHVLEHDPVGEIAAETMKQAARLALWHLHEAKRIIGAVEVPQAVADAKVLLDWLLDQGSDVAPKDVLHRGPSPLRDRGRRDEAIEVLAETHHVVRKRVGRTQEILETNPKLRGQP
jgi:hypothetical protein